MYVHITYIYHTYMYTYSHIVHRYTAIHAHACSHTLHIHTFGTVRLNVYTLPILPSKVSRPLGPSGPAGDG